ncbi:uncharacterized protein LOC107361363 [Tetranychus urticae]|uniref:Uncharacterized protein n=1 Tax=Tetranychus urticae TaxID=32264 RepID=T1K6R2_TETUR|nr:uncharacterized protein LOC107361363 [Tetranychus urticae]
MIGSFKYNTKLFRSGQFYFPFKLNSFSVHVFLVHLRYKHKLIKMLKWILVKMLQQNYDSNKTTFRVKFFGEYHDIVIDWDDDKYGYKQQLQISEQLEALTEIPMKYAKCTYLVEVLPDHELRGHAITNHTSYNHVTCIDPDYLEKDIICNAITRADGRFILVPEVHSANYETKYITVRHFLVPESVVPEGVCSRFVCQYKYTKTFFDKVKDVIRNEEVNSRTSSLAANNNFYLRVEEIYKELNVYQYIVSPCSLRDVPLDRILYLRTRG